MRRPAWRCYKARVGGGGSTFSSSPLASQGRVYLLSEDGDAFVLRAGDKYDEMAKNSLGEMSLATPAADADSLYVRTQTKLYRIKGGQKKAKLTRLASERGRPDAAHPVRRLTRGVDEVDDWLEAGGGVERAGRRVVGRRPAA